MKGLEVWANEEMKKNSDVSHETTRESYRLGYIEGMKFMRVKTSETLEVLGRFSKGEYGDRLILLSRVVLAIGDGMAEEINEAVGNE